jgi:cell division protein FtsB
MREFQERKRIRKIMSSRITLGVLCIVLGVLLFSVGRIYLRSAQAKKISEQVVRELEELDARKAKLEAQVQYLKTDIGREDELREKFNVKRPGERVLVIVDEEREVEPEIIHEQGVFLELWQSFKGLF